MNQNQESRTPAAALHLADERWIEVSAEWGVDEESRAAFANDPIQLDLDARTATCLFAHRFVCLEDSIPRAIRCERSTAHVS